MLDKSIMNQKSSYVVPTYPQLKSKSSSNEQMIPNKKRLNQKETKHLLFFSHNCPHSVSLLEELNKRNKLGNVNLICIDNRYTKDNITYITLQQNQNMPLPPMINSVPTLCILPNHEILKGVQIKHYFIPLMKDLEQEKQKLNQEPNSFDLGQETNGSFGVSSDSFSFWDSTQYDLSASGNGGLKQMYSYATIEGQSNSEIYTPQEENKDSKQGLSLEQLQQQRQNEL